MQKNYLFDDQITPWFKTKTFKIIVLILAILSIVTVVLFSEQIGDLLELFGLRAATEARVILIDGVGSGADGHTSFFDPGFTVDPPDSFMIDANNRLILNPNPTP